MPDYSKGIIYTIRSKDNLYVGSTLNLRTRKWKHKSNTYNENNPTYNQTLYKTIRANSGEWDMQPYSKYPCNSKVELTIEEERVRQLLKADMNMKSCGTGCSRNEYSKQWYEQNKDKINKQTKQYYKQNKAKHNEQMKQWYEQNKDKASEQNKQWYEKNKDKVSERRKQKVNCECGCIVTKGNISIHLKSKKHLKLIQSLEV